MYRTRIYAPGLFWSEEHWHSGKRLILSLLNTSSALNLRKARVKKGKKTSKLQKYIETKERKKG